jgi:hypothetical protein
MNMDFTRQLDIVAPKDLTMPITMIGLGGIGSYTVPILAKMGCSSLTGYDDDSVESHNIPNQYYRLSDIGTPKVEALSQIVLEQTGVSLHGIQEKCDGSQSFQGIVISGVDKMTPRHVIWQQIKWKAGIQLYLDARMGGQVAVLYAIRPCDPDDIRFYESKLFSEEETHELPCTARSIVYTVAFIAGLIANQIKKFAKGEPIMREIIWDAQTCTFIGKEA